MPNFEEDAEFNEDMDLWLDMVGKVGKPSASIKDDVKAKIAEQYKQAARIKDPKKRMEARAKISQDVRKRRKGDTVSLDESVNPIFRE